MKLTVHKSLDAQLRDYARLQEKQPGPAATDLVRIALADPGGMLTESDVENGLAKIPMGMRVDALSRIHAARSRRLLAARQTEKAQ